MIYFSSWQTLVVILPKVVKRSQFFNRFLSDIRLFKILLYCMCANTYFNKK